jgi:ketopantoate reductase
VSIEEKARTHLEVDCFLTHFFHVVAQQKGQDFTEVQVQAFVAQVIRDTAKNRSSMLQDVTQGRQTEIDYFNGYIVKEGRKLGISTLVNEELVNSIKGFEIRSSKYAKPRGTS